MIDVQSKLRTRLRPSSPILRRMSAERKGLVKAVAGTSTATNELL